MLREDEFGDRVQDGLTERLEAAGPARRPLQWCDRKNKGCNHTIAVGNVVRYEVSPCRRSMNRT